MPFVQLAVVASVALLGLAPNGVKAAAQVGPNGHYYELISGPVTWGSAKTGAEGSSLPPGCTLPIGGDSHLVTISDTDENSFVQTMVPAGESAWIGHYQTANLALGKTARQSSDYQGPSAELAVDGNTNPDWSGGSIASTNLESNPWWEVELGGVFSIQSVVVYNRLYCCTDRLSGAQVTLYKDDDVEPTLEGPTLSLPTIPANDNTHSFTVNFVGSFTANRVRISLPTSNYLSVAEVEVFGGVGMFEWVNGESPSNTYSNFDSANNEPDNGGTSGVDENYAAIYPSGFWEDEPDNEARAYIVEWDCLDTDGDGVPDGLNTAASVSGDPHFVTWRGERYDYMGQCDLELVSDPTFAIGKGLDIHIKTEIFDNWSYIKSAAIRIGNGILEVMGGTDGNHHWFNYKCQGELTAIGDFPVTFSHPKANSKSRSYIIDLGNKDDKIEIKTYKEFVRVNLNKPRKELYGNTVGLLGDFTSGKKLARDGVTEIEDYNEFGQEWQVLPGAKQLFHEVSGPQAPLQQCILPDKNAASTHRHRHLHHREHQHEHKRRHRHRHGRRLGAKEEEDEMEVTEAQAKTACEKAGVSQNELDSCVYDVMVTEDLDMAGSY